VSEKEYFISFVEEFGGNPKFNDWTFGRIEVHYPNGHPEQNQWGYHEEEIRLIVRPEKREQYYDFSEHWDFMHVTEYHYHWLKDFVAREYYDVEGMLEVMDG
jgi:hypothetical protein